MTTGNDETIRVNGNKYVRQIYGQPAGTFQQIYAGNEWGFTVDYKPLQEDPYLDFPTSLRKPTSWTMPSDGADLSLTPDQVKASVLAHAGCRLQTIEPPENPSEPPLYPTEELDDDDQALNEAFETGEKLYPALTAQNNTIPGYAGPPTPGPGASGVSPQLTTLTFGTSGADETDSFQVYFCAGCSDQDLGLAVNKVGNPIPYSSSPINVTIPFSLHPDEPHKWRVDSLNVGGKITDGFVWNFTTGS